MKSMALLVGVCLVFTLLGGAQAPNPAPSRILFSRAGPGEPGELGLFVSNADGSGERALAASGSLDYNPAWSADGQWIVFTSEREGSAELYRIKPDGSGLTRLTDHPAYDDQASVSPDGSEVVFVTTRADGTADLWILDLRTLQAKPLTSGIGGDFRPAWSPDGNWIAFSSDRASSMPMGKGRWEHLDVSDIYVVRVDGSGLKRLANQDNSCGSPKWSSDSRLVIAYCLGAEDTLPYRAAPADGETQIVSIDIRNGSIRTLSVGQGIKTAPSMLPAGVIAYVRRNSRGQGPFYSDGKTGPSGDIRYAAWPPDGERVAYHKRTPVTRSPWKKVWSRNSRYELVMSQNMPSFHPSGDRFVTQGVAPAAPLGRGINVVDSGSGTSRVLFQREGSSALAPQWSPRGDVIVFGLGIFSLFTTPGLGAQFLKPEDRVDGGGQVAVINADGSGFRALTTGANNNAFPSMSPDGERVVYRTFGADGNGLRIINLKDKSIMTLTSGYDNFPFWSPRGDIIMFSRQEKGDYEIFTIRPDGKDLRRLTSARGNDAHMGWSPDGEWIIFASSRLGFKDESLYTNAPQPYGELFVMRYNGEDVQQLTDNQWEDGAPAWQPFSSVQSNR